MSTNLDQAADVVERQTVAQDGLDKDLQRENVNHNHGALAPSSATETECLAPDLALIFTDALHLASLLFLATLHVLVITRRPLVLATFVLKVDAVFLECRHGVEAKLAVGVDLDTRSRHNHGRDGLVRFEKVLLERVGHGDEVRLEVVRVLHEKLRIDDGRQRLG